MKKFSVVAGAAAALMLSTSAFAVELEVTHWWTSGGEAAAVAEIQKAFDAVGGDTWVDGAIAGSSGVARPIIVSRIQGGNPMGATQINPGNDVTEFALGGKLLDLTALAEKEGWKDFMLPQAYNACVFEGKVFCVPTGLHSAQWMWTSRKVFTDAGLEQPKDWFELIADAPKLEEAGFIPLSVTDGWGIGLMLGDIAIGVGGIPLYLSIYKDRNLDAAGGPEMAKVFEAMDGARKITKPEAIFPQWNDAVGMVTSNKAAATVMGDWAQGEFAVANQKAGVDYDCLPGLGIEGTIDTGGDVFLFPVQTDPAVEAAQLKLASVIASKETQLAFNLKKGSLPIRGDLDMAAANDCMKKGLAILADPTKVFPAGIQFMDRDTIQQIEDNYKEFFTNPDITPAEAQAKFVEIVANAPKM